MFSFVIADKPSALRARDREAHAIVANLHDVGLAVAADLISGDQRIKIDSADWDTVLEFDGGGDEMNAGIRGCRMLSQCVRPIP